MIIGNHLVERKGLKKDSRLLIKLSPSLRSINQVISSEYQEWFLEKCHFSLSVGACRLCVGEPSMVLGRLTWKWWSEEHLKCLVEAIKRVDQEKQATPKKRANHDISSGILTLMLSCKHWSKEKASQPQQELLHLILSGSQFI